MTPEASEPDDGVAIAVRESILARLRRELLVWYLVSLGLAFALGLSLLWEYRTLDDLARGRIDEYRLLVAEKLDELHRLDLEEVAVRTRPRGSCERPLPKDDAASLLAEELGRAPTSAELDLLVERAAAFGVCDVGEIRHIYEDEVGMARIDTVYRLLLQRPADPVGRFIYGYWLASGVDVEAVARDIMASPEFRRLRRLSEP